MTRQHIDQTHDDDKRAPGRPLTIEAAAERVGCSPNHLRNLITAGRLRTVRYGRLVRILEADLEHYLMHGDDGTPARSKRGRA